MIVDPDFNSGCMSILKNFVKGIKIPMLTLENTESQ
jgi:hypothetical protein